MLDVESTFEYIISNQKPIYHRSSYSIREAYSKISRLFDSRLYDKILHNEFNQYIKPRKAFQIYRNKKQKQ